MRVVLDANIIVSAANGFHPPISPLAELFYAGLRGQYVLITSAYIVEEVRFALSKPFFVAHLAPDVGEQILDDLDRRAMKVQIEDVVEGVATHWQDDLVLSTALSGDADFLVTGDRELLDLVHPYPFRIIHPDDFLRYLKR